MRAIYRRIRHARYLYIKRNVKKVWGARYTLGARYLSKSTVQSIFYIIYFSPVSRNFLLLEHKYPPQRPVLEHSAILPFP